MLRHLLLPCEACLYGVAYARLLHLIRAPVPLDPQRTWDELTCHLPPMIDWVRTSWPIAPLRPLLLWAKMKQDHVLGIAAHYDVSNEFYELFLDRKTMFYSCADFHTDSDTLEQAQQNKADYILRLIDPQPGQRLLDLGCGPGSIIWSPIARRPWNWSAFRHTTAT